MKHILCPTFVVLLVVNYAQAAAVPFVELKGHTGWVSRTGSSPDGKIFFAGATVAGSRTIHFWDTKSGKELYTLPGAEAKFSPDGKKIITWRRVNDRSHGPFHIWDAESGKELFTLTAQSNRRLDLYLTFTPDSRKIRMMGSYPRTKFFDAETGKELVTSGGAVGFSRDGKTMFSWNLDAVYIWDDELGKEVFTFPGRFEYISPCISPDGKRIITRNDNELRFWDIESGEELFTLPGTFHSVRPNEMVIFSPDGKRFITRNGNEYRFWDLESGKELFTLPGAFGGFSSDGKRIIARNDSELRFLDIESGKELYTLPAQYRRVTPDGKKIVTMSDSETHIWDAGSGNIISVLPERDSFPSISRDSKKIFIAVENTNESRAYDVESGKYLYSLLGRVNGYLLGGKIVCTSENEDDEDIDNYNHIYRYWNVETGEELRQLRQWGDITDDSPDGTRLVLWNGHGSRTYIWGWDGESVKELYSLPGRFRGFLADGQKILTANGLETHIWDATSGEELHVLPGGSLGLTPDGKPITVMEGNTFRIWDISAIETK